MIVDPWGKILAECDPEKELDVAVAEIDVEKIHSVRKNMPCLEHRRSDIYSLAALKLKRNDFTSNFMFQTFPIPEETIFYESQHSLAFCNIRCVVIGRILFNIKYIVQEVLTIISLTLKTKYIYRCSSSVAKTSS